ncbi:MAG: TlpA disulfide reductase family protein [Sphingomicrobium sp.]
MRLIVCLLALSALSGCDREKPLAPQEANVDASIDPSLPGKGVDRSHAGDAAPTVPFNSPDGTPFDLGKFKGTPVLVNLWASWCAPCVKELPTLEKLEERHVVDGNLAVISVSQDMGPKESVDAFLASKKIGRFAAFHDQEMKLTGALGIEVMPTTMLYDAQGREVWRFVGDLDWSGTEAAQLLSEVAPKG